MPFASDDTWSVRQRHRVSSVEQVHRSWYYELVVRAGASAEELAAPDPLSPVSKRDWEKSVHDWRHGPIDKILASNMAISV